MDPLFYFLLLLCSPGITVTAFIVGLACMDHTLHDFHGLDLT